jgi:thiol:disulfide interchange protein DsbC
MHKSLLKTITIAVLAASATATLADESSIRKSLTEAFRGANIKSVSPTPMKGIWEVIAANNEVVFTDDDGHYMISGEMVDIKEKRNLTQERLEKLSVIKFDDLPLNDAIKTVRGNGARKVAVFADPDCPYCRKFEQELEKVDNVTVYTFLFPLDMLHPQSSEKSRKIWCANDKNKAWHDWMTKSKAPENSGSCPTPIESNLALGKKYGVNGTPTILLGNGRRIPGMVDSDKLDKMLENK